MLNISQVILVRTDSNLCRKELTVHWSAPNSLIRSYHQPCTNSMWGDESAAMAPIIWLNQTVDAQNEEFSFPNLLITLRDMSIPVDYGQINHTWPCTNYYATTPKSNKNITIKVSDGIYYRLLYFTLSSHIFVPLKYRSITFLNHYGCNVQYQVVWISETVLSLYSVSIRTVWWVFRWLAK